MSNTPRKNGLGALPGGLMRPTIPPPDDDQAEASAPDSAEGTELEPEPAKQGRGGARRRRARVDDAAVKGRKLSLSDDVHERLWLYARQKKKTASAVANDILDRNLPRLKIERDE